jgi:hypothetical protein
MRATSGSERFLVNGSRTKKVFVPASMLAINPLAGHVHLALAGGRRWPPGGEANGDAGQKADVQHKATFIEPMLPA